MEEKRGEKNSNKISAQLERREQQRKSALSSLELNLGARRIPVGKLQIHHVVRDLQAGEREIGKMTEQRERKDATALSNMNKQTHKERERVRERDKTGKKTIREICNR